MGRLSIKRCLPMGNKLWLLSFLIIFLGNYYPVKPTATAAASPSDLAILDISPQETSSFEFSFPQPGKRVSPGEKLNIHGAHKLSLNDNNVWIFLTDAYQGYYVQSPPVELFADGTWKGTNIRPNKGIEYIVAVSVNSEGDKVVREWLSVPRFGKIEKNEVKGLPGYRELNRVRIVTPSASE